MVMKRQQVFLGSYKQFKSNHNKNPQKGIFIMVTQPLAQFFVPFYQGPYKPMSYVGLLVQTK